MALIVQKYGGTSVGTIDRIRAVADKIIKTRSLGHDLVVVVSAMVGETDRLVQLAHEMSALPDPREFDVLLSTGEQVTIALLALALLEKGCKACSYTGGQVRIQTDKAHNKASIVGIESAKISADLKAGKVVVVAGFQGVDEHGNITTLGRGGSDTTAVALAAALKADECQIYTDVDGVYTADPRIVPEAEKLSQVTIDEMLEMASNGAKVMQIKAVEYASHYQMPVRVLSSFDEGEGTLIVRQIENFQHTAISGIAFNREEVKLVVKNLLNAPGMAAKIFGPLSLAHIEVDMIVQMPADGKTIDLAFTIHQRDFKRTQGILQEVVSSLGFGIFMHDQAVAKLCLVGVGIRSHASIASKMFQVLGDENIDVQLVSTSEIKISVIIEEKYLERAVHALHRVFQLGTVKEEKEIVQC
jgi:aspartate kinase